MDDSSGGGIQLGSALRQRWWLVIGTPFVTAVMALMFVFWVRPLFESTTTLRFTEDQSPFGGAAAAGVGDGGGGLSLLASLAGRSVPIQSEMSVLRSRSLSLIVVDELGLRLEVDEPKRMAWDDLFARVELYDDVAEGEYELEAAGTGFQVRGEVLVGRDPFRPIMNEQYEVRDFGTAAPGQALPIPGMNVVLAASAAGVERIVFKVLPAQDALDGFQERVVVSKPEREADLVQVAVQWTDPALAARIAEVLTRHFIERREALQAEQYGRTAGFLSGQLDSLNLELETAEERLKRYREAEGIVEPEAQATAAVEQLAEVQARRDLLVAERRALTQLMDQVAADAAAGPQAVESPYRRLVFFPTLLQNAATAELLRLMGELENERAELYGRRTAESREASVITERIGQLEGQLRVMAETYLEGIDNQVQSFDALLSNFSDQLARVPAVEQEYLRRRRQVEVLTQLYVFMEMRQKEAEVTSAGEAGGVRIIDRPAVAIEPIRPKPTLTLGLALVVGLILGVAGAVVLDHAAAPPRQT